ncbi:MAG: MBL fold metallo-hydrolase [Chloroflexi bacterium]|nr:MBL fold metallo-hydrolase [Chloroflexota bacterium]
MEILPQVHWVKGMRGANCYLLAGETLVLIDTGWPGNTQRVLAYLKQIGRRPEDLAYILLTHNHLDHAGSAAEIKEATGAKLLAHADDCDIINDEPFLVPKTRVHERMARKSRILPARVDQWVIDGEVLPFLDGARVVHVPGHTPGSICLYLDKRRVLLTGDVLLNDEGHLERARHPDGTVFQFEESLDKLVRLYPDACFFSHGQPILKGAWRWLRDMAVLYPPAPSWRRTVRNFPRLLHFALRTIRQGI